MLCFLLSVDIYYKSDFVFFESTWKESILCHTVCFSTFLSRFYSLFCVGLLTLSKYMVVKYPMDSKFKITSFVMKCIWFGLAGSISLSAVFSTSLFIVKLYSPLCFPLGHTKSPVLNLTVTLALVFSCIVSCISIFYIHLALIFTLQDKPQIASNQTVKLTPNVIKKSCSAIVSHILTCLPSSVIFILTLVITKYPYEMLIWAFVAVIPANFIQDFGKCIKFVFHKVKGFLICK